MMVGKIPLGKGQTSVKQREIVGDKMTTDSLTNIFSKDVLDSLFPAKKADEFFEALYGDTEEGAYDISLSFVGSNDAELEFALELKQRPGKCLACNLTYGLPDVFTRHPLINIKGLVGEIDKIAGNGISCGDWKIGRTREISRELHVVPLIVAIGK